MNENKQHPNDTPAKLKISVNVAETKKIFTEMAKGRDNKFYVNPAIVNAMNHTLKAKQSRNTWKGESK